MVLFQNRTAPQIRPFRDVPIAGSQGWKLAAPITSHMNDVGCPQIQCSAHINGWVTIVPRDSGHADYIRRLSGRRFREEITEDNLSRFWFEPGQECFDRHRQRNGRDAYPIRQIAHEKKLVEYDRWLWDFQEETYKFKRERG